MIPRAEWLAQAQHLCIGQKKRIRHNHERTLALDVYNNDDSWSCWCHRCKEGGTVWKQHQHIRVARVEPDRVQPVPADVIRIRDATRYIQQQIWSLLVKKGIAPEIINEELLWYSPSVNRLLLLFQGRALGRSLSELQLPKWLMYGQWQNHPRIWLTKYSPCAPVVITEDALSAHKVGYAMRGYPISVLATLGTRLTDSSMTLLLENSCKHLLTMYDGDSAGKSGAHAVKQRVSPFGITCSILELPYGYDPKDCSIAQIQALIGDKLNG